MTPTAIRFIDAATAAGHVVMQLAAARAAGDRSAIPGSLAEADPAIVRRWAAWVGRGAVLRSRGAWWLWCEPRKGARRGMGQFVMDVPAGRYLVDVLDASAHAWFSRESAGGAPLVAGLPATGRPVLVRIRCVSRERPTVAGDLP